MQGWYPRAMPPRLLGPGYTLAAGWLSTALLILCCATGLLLTFQFCPVADEAYSSLADITSVVPYGRLVRNVHRFAAEGLLVVAAVHLVRVLLTHSYTGPRKANWLMGLGLLALAVLANFTGYVLPWDQTACWGLTICASMLDAVPLAGPALREVLVGPGPVDGTCLPRLYALHVIVAPAGLLLLAGYHRRRFRRDLASRANGAAEPGGMVSGWPDLWYWELAAMFAATAALVAVANHFDAPLAGPANPQEPPNPAKAPWYFLWLQELASHVPAAGAVAIAAGLFGFVVLVPWLAGEADGPPGSHRRARATTVACLIVCAAVVCLDVVGLVFRGANWSFVMPWR